MSTGTHVTYVVEGIKHALGYENSVRSVGRLEISKSIYSEYEVIYFLCGHS